MNQDELDILKRGESETVEFKESFRDDALKQVFYDLEIIERYGSGIYRMLDACAAAGLPEPDLEESTGGFRMTFHKVADVGRGVGEQVSEQVDEQVGEQVVRMLNACRKEPLPKKELLKAAGFANAYLNYKRHVAPLLTSGLIEMTLPDNPRSSNQKYRLTEHGRAVLATVQKKVDNET